MHRENSNSKTRLTMALFIIYLIVLFWILLFKLGVPFRYMGNKRSINLVPFSKPVILNGKADIGEMILNVVVFIPFGIYAAALFKRWAIVQKLFLILLTSLIIETLQYIFWIGASDITDVITNTLGGIIGLLMFAVIEKLINNSIKTQKFINIVAAIGTVLIVSLLLLLKMNMLPVRFQ